MGARFPYYLLADSPQGRPKESQLTAEPLPPAGTTGDIRPGFVYERVQHITLKSIANNPDIVEGMTRDAIDAVIRRHAEFQVLYDKPYEDTKKVRVAGPFTVESLSPHRSLAYAGSAVDGTGAVNADISPAGSRQDDGLFDQTILANLRAAGIQNGRRIERLIFDTVEPYAGTHIQAVGVREDAADGTPRAGRNHDRAAVWDSGRQVHKGGSRRSHPYRGPRPPLRACLRLRPAGAGDRG